MKCYAFDVDGVVIDVSERLRRAKELSRYGLLRNFWDAFFSEELLALDRPRDVGVKLVKERAAKGEVIVITGRPMRLKEITLEEFIKATGVIPSAIYMRKDRDYRSSHIVKVELLSKALRDGYEVVEYHDDDELVLSKIKERYPWIKLYYHLGSNYVVF